MSFVRMHFCVVVTRGNCRGICPKNMGLNCSIPAMVRSTVGSSGTSDELGRRRCPFFSKNSRNLFLISLPVSRGGILSCVSFVSFGAVDAHLRIIPHAALRNGTFRATRTRMAMTSPTWYDRVCGGHTLSGWEGGVVVPPFIRPVDRQPMMFNTSHGPNTQARSQAVLAVVEEGTIGRPTWEEQTCKWKNDMHGTLLYPCASSM